jgi:hypothetical protein
MLRKKKLRKKRSHAGNEVNNNGGLDDPTKTQPKQQVDYVILTEKSPRKKKTLWNLPLFE